MGVVRIDEIVARAGLDPTKVFAIAGSPDRQTLARKVLFFNKRPLGSPSVNKDIAAALRANLGNAASYYLGAMGASADLRAAQNYILANEAGWTLHSHLRSLQSGSVGRVFTVYNPAKQQVLETQNLSEALRLAWVTELKNEVRRTAPRSYEGRVQQEAETAARVLDAGLATPFAPTPR